MRVIKVSELKPFGVFQSLFEKLESKIVILETEGYSKEVAKIFALIAEMQLSSWMDQNWRCSDSQKKENEMIVLLSESYLIRLNNIAQKHINKIDMEPVHVQLAKSGPAEKFFKNVIFEA